MALNKFMHQRNIYKSPPDFTKLAKLYTEFAVVTKLDATGKVTIDFKDPNALRILTKCLLKHDFNLDVDIPANRLVPTLPLRLNYVLWIEDLLTSIQRVTDIQGLDLGTGACAIYPLLAAVKNKWGMVATDTDAESIMKAKENVEKNNLQDLIKLKKNTTTSIIDHLFSDENKPHFDFCMCNPPFYSNIQELYESRSPARLPPKNAFTGSPQELITEGGELEFCRKLIKESKQYRDSILIFTTMIGHKYNFNVLLQDLKSEGIKYTHTEFCQGRVTRWGLAWTYKDYDIYNLVPPRDKPRKKSSPTVHVLPELANLKCNLEATFNKIRVILDNLSIHYNVVEKRGNSISMNIKAHANTWSNQRRKRRLMKRIETESKKPKLDIEDTSSSQCEEKMPHSLEESKICQGTNEIPAKEPSEKSVDSNISDTVVHAFVKLLKKENNVLLEVEFLDGSAGKEGLHQIVQYIKNNWK